MPEKVYICPSNIHSVMNAIILGAIGTWQILLIVLALVLLFGSAKIPELMRNLGKGVNEFKKSTKGENKEDSAPEKKDPEKEK